MSYEVVTAALSKLDADAVECGRKDLEEYDGAVAVLEGCGTKRAIAESEMQQRLAQPRELIK